MKMDLADQEREYLVTAIDQSIASAKRLQNSGKTPQIKQVYQQHESDLQTLRSKLLALR